MHEQASVVVIGAGLCGLATAVYLAREGVDDVVLIDRLPRLTDGALGLGQVEAGVLEHPQRTQRALGDGFAELLDFQRRNRELVRAEGLFEPCGRLWAALDAREPAALAEAVEVWRSVGETVSLLDAPEARNRTACAVTAAIDEPLWGRLHPSRAVTQLEEAAREAGVRVYLGHAAELVEVEPVKVVAGPLTVDAELVVLTAGMGCAGLSDRLASALTPVRESALAVAGGTPIGVGRAGQGWTTWTHRDGLTTVSGCRWATAHMEAGETDATVTSPRVQGRLEAFAREKLTLDGPVQDRWSWITADTRDHLPLIGPLQGQPRVLMATGFGVQAASWSFAAARALVDGIVHGDTTTPPCVQSRRLVRWSR
jgi:glycine/D-amino acid oxidase-like deaminating enzyme